jgi:hypothetical protein
VTSTEPDSDRLTLRASGFRPKTPLETDVANSSLVVRVRVTEVSKARWNTLDGSAPSIDTLAKEPTSTDPIFLIYTPLQTEIVSVLIGTAPSQPLLLKQEGGTVGDLSYRSEASPDLGLGAEAIVFVYQAEADPAGLWTINEAYLINGEQATSRLDGETTTMASLLDEINQAASVGQVMPTATASSGQ